MPDRAAPSDIVVRELPAGGEARWDGFVRAHRDGTFFHLSGWRRVIEKAFGHRTYYLQAERGGGLQGVLPLTQLRGLLSGNALVSNAFCVYGGPIAESEAALSALVAEAAVLMNRLGARHLEFRSRRRICPDWQCRSDLYVTFRKPISQDHEANMKAIPRKQRAMIRKGISLGLSSVVDEEADRLHHVYAESVRNLGTPVFSKEYFKLLKQVFGPDCDIVTVLDGPKPVASVLNFYFRDEVLPYYGGGVADARRLAANDFMYWEVMRRAADRGCRSFDFGRSKVGTGAYAFKHNWGFPAEPLFYEYRLAPGRSMPDVNPLNPKLKPFIAAWKRLPLPVAKAIGPYIVRGLG